MIFSPYQTNTQNDITKLSNTAIERATSHKFLGLVIDEHLTWWAHISHINNKISRALYTLRQTKNLLTPETLKSLYFALIHSHILYCNIAWGGACPSVMQKTTTLFKQAIRTIHKAKYNAHTEPLLKKSQLLTLEHLHEQQIVAFMYDYLNSKLPSSYNNAFPLVTETRTRTTRSLDIFSVPTPKTKFIEKLPFIQFPKIANKHSALINNSN